MTTLHHEERNCPVCGSKVSVTSSGSSSSLGWQMTDLRQATGQHAPHLSAMSCCGGCGYVADSSGFQEGAESSARDEFDGEALREQALEDLPSVPKEGLIPFSPGYFPYRAFLCARALGRERATQIDHLVSACWELPVSREFPVYGDRAHFLRTRTLDLLVECLRDRSLDQVELRFVYLRAELCRRDGRFDLAKTAFQDFLDNCRVDLSWAEHAHRLALRCTDEDDSDLAFSELTLDIGSWRDGERRLPG